METGDILKERVIVAIERLEGMVNDDEYNGYSIHYYYTHEAMPTEINNIRWAISVMCDGFISDEDRVMLLDRVNSIVY